MNIGKSIKEARRAIFDKLPADQFARAQNTLNSIERYPHRIAPHANGLTFVVSEGGEQWNMCRRRRVGLYRRGIRHRLTKLAADYLLDRINEPLEGAFVDCGANVGELGDFSRLKGLQYFAFEPETLEATCCDLNNYDGKPQTNRFGLWSSDTTLTFYSKPSSGDSSLFPMEGSVASFQIDVRSLDSFAAQVKLPPLAILKIEAEGAEPEILSGAANTLKTTRYVTVDCGFERGFKQESTLVPVFNFLLDSGFEAIDWNYSRLIVLFRRKDA